MYHNSISQQCNDLIGPPSGASPPSGNCVICRKPLGATIIAKIGMDGDAKAHLSCFRCTKCNLNFITDKDKIGNPYVDRGNYYCGKCHLPTCSICGLLCDTQYYTDGDLRFHKGCYALPTCFECKQTIEGEYSQNDQAQNFHNHCYDRVEARGGFSRPVSHISPAASKFCGHCGANCDGFAFCKQCGSKQ